MLVMTMMKPLLYALALVATTSTTMVFAEGGADRLKERSEQWALQRQQAQEVVAKEKPQQDQHQAPTTDSSS